MCWSKLFNEWYFIIAINSILQSLVTFQVFGCNFNSDIVTSEDTLAFEAAFHLSGVAASPLDFYYES